MRHFILLVLLFAVSASPALAAPIATTPPLEIQASSPIEDATVNLYCSLKSGSKRYSTSGSGVFISDRGVILTNAHVARYFLLASQRGRVRGECVVRTGSPATDTYTASVLYFPAAWVDLNVDALRKGTTKGTGETDFAFLYVTGAKSSSLPARFPSLPLWLVGAAEGETVTVAGYPAHGLDADDIRSKLPYLSTEGVVTSVRGFASEGNDAIAIASSTAASAGVSGGPVVREGDMLAGIVAAKSDSTLRAITLAHINSALMDQTGSGIFAMLVGDLGARAAANRALIAPKQILLLRDALLKTR